MKSEMEEIEMEEVVIEEFRRSKPRVNRRRRKNKQYKEYGILGGFALAFLLAVLAGIFWLNMPAVLVCVILVLEFVIAVCLHDVPVWLHGIEVMISIVAGILCGRMPFMVIAVAIYVGTILTLYFLRQQRG